MEHNRIILQSSVLGQTRPAKQNSLYLKPLEEYWGPEPLHPLLEANPGFRQILSTIDASVPFVYEGLSFYTIMHAQMYKRYALCPSEAIKFSLNSSTTLSTDIPAVLLHTCRSDAQWHRLLTFLEKPVYLTAITAAKFEKNPTSLPAQLLIATETAELWQQMPSLNNRTIQFYRLHYLEQIRSRLIAATLNK